MSLRDRVNSSGLRARYNETEQVLRESGFALNSGREVVFDARIRSSRETVTKFR